VIGQIVSASPSIVVDLILVIDDDLTNLHFISRSLNPGFINLAILLSNYNILIGFHKFSFYVIDRPYGRISNARTYDIEILHDATISLSPSATISKSPFPSASASAGLNFSWAMRASLLRSVSRAYADSFFPISESVLPNDRVLPFSYAAVETVIVPSLSSCPSSLLDASDRPYLSGPPQFHDSSFVPVSRIDHFSARCGVSNVAILSDGFADFSVPFQSHARPRTVILASQATHGSRRIYQSESEPTRAIRQSIASRETRSLRLSLSVLCCSHALGPSAALVLSNHPDYSPSLLDSSSFPVVSRERSQTVDIGDESAGSSTASRGLKGVVIGLPVTLVTVLVFLLSVFLIRRRLHEQETDGFDDMGYETEMKASDIDDERNDDADDDRAAFWADSQDPLWADERDHFRASCPEEGFI
jgi:hypothetical protein